MPKIIVVEGCDEEYCPYCKREHHYDYNDVIRCNHSNYIISDKDVEEIKRLQKSGYDQTESIIKILTANEDESAVDVIS